MKIAFALVVTLVIVAISGCSGTDPKYKSDMNKICNAEKLSGSDSIADKSEKAMAMATWLRAEIQTEKAKEFMGSLGGQTPSGRADALRTEAKKAGVEPCPMADAP